jgi:hypothetical protein
LTVSTLLAVLYYIIFLLATVNVNGFYETIFLKNTIKIILFFILFVANLHLFLTLRKDEYNLRKQISIMFNGKSSIINVISWKQRVWRSKTALLAGFLLFISYFFIIFVYCPYPGNYVPLMSEDVKQHPYILYMDAGSKDSSLTNCTYSINSIYENMVNINSSLFSIDKNLSLNGQDKKSIKTLAKVHDIYNKSNLITSYSYVYLCHMQNLQMKHRQIKDIPAYFYSALNLYFLHFFHYSISSDFDNLNDLLLLDLERIHEARYRATYIDTLSSKKMPSDFETENYINELYNIVKYMDICYNDINLTTNIFNGELKPPKYLYESAFIVDLFFYLVTVAFFIAFMYNFCIITNLLSIFREDSKNLSLIRFYSNKDFERIKALRLFKNKLNDYVLYIIFIFFMSWLIYLLMRTGPEHYLNMYIDGLLLIIYISIILILIGLSTKKMCSFVQICAINRLSELEPNIRKSKEINNQGLVDEWNMIKRLLDEFSIHKNILSIFSSLAPLVTVIITLWK